MEGCTCWKGKGPAGGKCCPHELCCLFQRCTGPKSGCFVPVESFLFALAGVFTWLPGTCPLRKNQVLAGDLPQTQDTLKESFALLFLAFCASQRSCGDSEDMRLSQVCNISCTICSAHLVFHQTTVWWWVLHALSQEFVVDSGASLALPTSKEKSPHWPAGQFTQFF